MAERKSPATAAMHHSAWTFDSLDDLLDRYQELAAKGIEPAVPIQHGVTTSLYYRDPDGNFVELQIDNFASPDEATGYMEGPEYDSDAVGPSFDVQRMVEARRNGASVQQLTTRAWALSGPDLRLPVPGRLPQARPAGRVVSARDAARILVGKPAAAMDYQRS